MQKVSTTILDRVLKSLLRLTHTDSPRVLYQILQTQYKKSYINIVGSLGVAFTLLFAVDGAYLYGVVWIWLLLHCALGLFRYFRLQKFNNSESDSKNNMYWYKEMLLIHIVSGLLWGLTPFVFFNVDSGSNIYILFAVTCSVMASSVVLIYLPAGYLVSSFFVLPLLSYAAFLLDNSFNLLSILILFYFVMMMVVSIESNRSVADAIVQRFINEDLVAQLEASNLAKSKFLATASHDLRQPIQALSLLTAAANETGNADRNTLNSMQRSIDNLNILFNSLLDVSNLDSGVIEIHPEAISMYDFLEEIQDQFSKAVHLDDLSIHLDCPKNIIAYTDPILTQRIIVNLISNALKFTSYGKVSISVEYDAEVATICIADTGAGIPENELEAIFREFYQLNNHSHTAQKGMGLGLSIVKRLVDLQNHRITVSSQLGEGSQFYLSLPIATSQQIQKNKPQKTTQSSFDASQYTLLVIENEPTILNAMELLLSKWGYKTLIAKNAHEAHEQTDNTKHIDLIISDYGLDDTHSGIEISQHLKDKLKKEIPTIIITGSTDADHIQDIKQANNTLLTKPIVPGRLRIALEHLLKS